MTTVLVLFLVISLLSNVVFYFIMRRFALRTMQFDNAFNKIQDDVEVFIEYFDSLLAKSTFSNSQDVIALSSNMKIMKNRFEQHVSMFHDFSVGRERIADEIKPEPPVTVD